MEVILLTGFMLLGAVLGSAINAAVYRLPRRIAYSHGRSRCPHCSHELSVVDLVPILSWIFLRGRCRYCSVTIGLRYVAVEILMAFGYGLAFWLFEISTRTMWAILFWSLIIFMAFLHHEYKKCHSSKSPHSSD